MIYQRKVANSVERLNIKNVEFALKSSPTNTLEDDELMGSSRFDISFSPHLPSLNGSYYVPCSGRSAVGEELSEAMCELMNEFCLDDDTVQQMVKCIVTVTPGKFMPGCARDAWNLIHTIRCCLTCEVNLSGVDLDFALIGSTADVRKREKRRREIDTMAFNIPLRASRSEDIDLDSGVSSSFGTRITTRLDDDDAPTPKRSKSQEQRVHRDHRSVSEPVILPTKSSLSQERLKNFTTTPRRSTSRERLTMKTLKRDTSPVGKHVRPPKPPPRVNDPNWTDNWQVMEDPNAPNRGRLSISRLGRTGQGGSVQGPNSLNTSLSTTSPRLMQLTRSTLAHVSGNNAPSTVSNASATSMVPLSTSHENTIVGPDAGESRASSASREFSPPIFVEHIVVRPDTDSAYPMHSGDDATEPADARMLAMTDSADEMVVYHDSNDGEDMQIEQIPEDQQNVLAIVVSNFGTQHEEAMTQWVSEATMMQNQLRFTHSEAIYLAGKAEAELRAAQTATEAEESAQGKLHEFEAHAQIAFRDMQHRFTTQAQSATTMFNTMQNLEATREAERIMYNEQLGHVTNAERVMRTNINAMQGQMQRREQEFHSLLNTQVQQAQQTTRSMLTGEFQASESRLRNHLRNAEAEYHNALNEVSMRDDEMQATEFQNQLLNDKHHMLMQNMQMLQQRMEEDIARHDEDIKRRDLLKITLESAMHTEKVEFNRRIAEARLETDTAEQRIHANRVDYHDKLDKERAKAANEIEMKYLRDKIQTDNGNENSECKRKCAEAYDKIDSLKTQLRAQERDLKAESDELVRRSNEYDHLNDSYGRECSRAETLDEDLKDERQVAQGALARAKRIQQQLTTCQSEKAESLNSDRKAEKATQGQEIVPYVSGARTRTKSRQPQVKPRSVPKVAEPTPAPASSRARSKTPRRDTPQGPNSLARKATLSRKSVSPKRQKAPAATTSVPAEKQVATGIMIDPKNIGNAQGIVDQYKALLEHCHGGADIFKIKNIADRVNLPIELIQPTLQGNRDRILRMITLACVQERQGLPIITRVNYRELFGAKTNSSSHNPEAFERAKMGFIEPGVILFPPAYTTHRANVSSIGIINCNKAYLSSPNYQLPEEPQAKFDDLGNIVLTSKPLALLDAVDKGSSVRAKSLPKANVTKQKGASAKPRAKSIGSTIDVEVRQAKASKTKKKQTTDATHYDQESPQDDYYKQWWDEDYDGDEGDEGFGNGEEEEPEDDPCWEEGEEEEDGEFTEDETEPPTDNDDDDTKGVDCAPMARLGAAPRRVPRTRAAAVAETDDDDDETPRGSAVTTTTRLRQVTKFIIPKPIPMPGWDDQEIHLWHADLTEVVSNGSGMPGNGIISHMRRPLDFANFTIEACATLVPKYESIERLLYANLKEAFTKNNPEFERDVKVTRNMRHQAGTTMWGSEILRMYYMSIRTNDEETRKLAQDNWDKLRFSDYVHRVTGEEDLETYWECFKYHAARQMWLNGLTPTQKFKKLLDNCGPDGKGGYRCQALKKWFTEREDFAVEDGEDYFKYNDIALYEKHINRISTKRAVERKLRNARAHINKNADFAPRFSEAATGKGAHNKWANKRNNKGANADAGSQWTTKPKKGAKRKRKGKDADHGGIEDGGKGAKGKDTRGGKGKGNGGKGKGKGDKGKNGKGKNRDKGKDKGKKGKGKGGKPQTPIDPRCVDAESGKEFCWMFQTEHNGDKRCHYKDVAWADLDERGKNHMKTFCHKKCGKIATDLIANRLAEMKKNYEAKGKGKNKGGKGADLAPVEPVPKKRAQYKAWQWVEYYKTCTCTDPDCNNNCPQRHEVDLANLGPEDNKKQTTQRLNAWHKDPKNYPTTQSWVNADQAKEAAKSQKKPWGKGRSASPMTGQGNNGKGKRGKGGGRGKKKDKNK